MNDAINLAQIVALIRALESAAKESEIEADLRAEAGVRSGAAFKRGHSQGLRDALFQLKPLCGMGKLE